MRKPLRFTIISRFVLIIAVMLCCLIVPFAAVKFASAAGIGTKAAIKLSEVVGPPTSFTKVTGANFGASEAVKLYFDTKVDGSTTTTSTGTFSFTLKIPRIATPGSHTIKATGQTSQLSATAPFLVRTDWSQAGFDAAQTRYNPYENVISASNAAQLTNLWTNQYTQGVMTTPIVVNGRVFISADKFYALDATTGAVIWSLSNGGTTPAVDAGIVFTISGNQLDALKASTGALLWSDPINGGATASPTIAHGVVYVASYSGSIYAFNEQTGKQLWSAAVCNAIQSTPAVANGLIYVGCTDGTVYAGSTKNGMLQWAFTQTNSVYTSVTVADGLAYFTDISGTLWAMNALNGTQVWKVFVANGAGIGSPSVVGNTVFVNNFGVFAFNAQTGALLWSNSVGNTIIGYPSIANGVVYVIDNDADATVIAINAATGTTLGALGLNLSTSSSMPVIANGMVFVGAGTSGRYGQGNMYAFGLKTL